MLTLTRLGSQYDALAVRSAIGHAPVLLFGAGKLGRQILGLLRANGVEPVAFIDNRQVGGVLEGLPILGPAESALRFGSTGIFVTTSWRPAVTGGMSDMRKQLRALGCETVIPFPWILWAFNGPAHYLWEQPANIAASRAAIESTAGLFHDEFSRDLFWRQVKFRESADSDLLPPLATHPQYFPEFIQRVPTGERFVDCGAFTGDSLAALHAWDPDFARGVAFEADPGTFSTLQNFAAQFGSKVDCRQLAVSSTAGVLRFAANGESGAAVSEEGDVEVRAAALDAELRDFHPTFIKMDIEGAEVDALNGAAQIIRESEPVLAICVYHRQDDLWKIPQLMRSLMPAAALLLRSYFLDGLDTVCYAVPRARLL